MNSPSSRLLKIPTIATSISTPNLTQLERKFSLSHSDDTNNATYVPPDASSISSKLATLEEEAKTGISVSTSLPPPLLRTASEMISSSAPGSLQSSPRGNNKSAGTYVAPATPEAVDRPRCDIVV